ncbi:MAG: tetratricopeptide repeat protein [Chthoniobacterales bacterium]|nr:tetratricopeptide repeat protein [Chthoniobacterales bacterium]
MTAQLINGRDGFNKSDEESYRKALTLFEQALNKDPTLARAWSGIAAVWNYLADVYVRPLEGYPASRDAALKALAIDPRNVQALCYLAEANQILHWDMKGADAQFREAIKIDPNYGEAYLFLGISLIHQGERETGSAALRQAVKLDPLSASTRHFVSGQLTLAGMLDEALVEAKRTYELDPTYLYESSRLGQIYLAKGDLEEAIKLYEEGERRTRRPSAGLAIAYARIGRKADAEGKLEELLQKARQTYYRADQIATVYAALGQTEMALEWLERAYSEHSSSLFMIGVRSEFRPLRQDPRFVDLVKRIGLDPAKVFRD